MNDKTLVERAVAVPLLERLRRVPNDARLEYEHDSCHHSLFPIGAMCHEAATRIEALEAALRDMLQAVCGETGFAAAVRNDAGLPYPWPALDIAEERAKQALESQP